MVEREGDVPLDFDPATETDATLAFIGRIRTPWRPGHCPRNLRQARELGGTGTLCLAPAYRLGLQHLSLGQPIIVLYWMDRDRRDLIVQHPRHSDQSQGVFALRSPARPTPIAMAAVTRTPQLWRPRRLHVHAID
ncbi:MAG: TrmO family methyltransferase [Candidatus Competibacterales bacterium]